MPIRKPRMVASTMPSAATSSVLMQADPECAAIGRCRLILDQRLADVEAGGVLPEAEAGRDLGARQVLGGVVDRAPGQEHDHRAQHRLIGDAAHLRDCRSAALSVWCPRPRPSGRPSRPKPRPSSAPTARTAGRPCSTARSARARSSAASPARRCARTPRRNCRPA